MWCSVFLGSYANFCEPDFSDHASCGVVLETINKSSVRPFCFYNYLLHIQDFSILIREQWYSINIVGSTMFRVSKKLQKLKACIREFNKDNYSDLEKKVVEAHDLLLMCQHNTLVDPSLSNANLELEAQRKWHILLKAEESYFCQKSRITWLREGDSNAGYFHRMADTRKSLITSSFSRMKMGIGLTPKRIL